MNKNAVDPSNYLNKTYNELTIRSIFKEIQNFPGGGKKNEIFCLCDCSCGVKRHRARLYHVRVGEVRSCGHLLDAIRGQTR